MLLADATGIRAQRPKGNHKVTINRTNTNIPKTNQSANLNKYHFVFAPFINHNFYFKTGNYDLSGLDGGFITAFSGKLTPSNALGAHFGFSYGKLNDKNDKTLNIKAMNLMLGLHYQFDMIYSMYLKTRADFFYFSNEISSSSIMPTKPNNVGFGVSVSYGKDFDFKSAGILGLEGGFDYKALSSNELRIQSTIDNMQIYNKAVYNLIYFDLGINYNTFLNSKIGLWGLNAGLGVKANLAPKLAKGTIIIDNNALNIIMDNDRFLSYINMGGSYILNAKNFAMEFGLHYNGSFGDRAISNGGSLEWKVFW